MTPQDFDHDASAATRAETSGPDRDTDRGHQGFRDDRQDVVEWLSADDDINLQPGWVELKLTAPDL
jgi:hypothetical protein